MPEQSTETMGKTDALPLSKPPKPLTGASFYSKALDVFVISHTLTAASFAISMLVFPELFSYMVNNPQDFTAITSDSIRWASPFVFGFAGLAALSLSMPALIRWKIALLFTGAFTLATVVGISVEMTGRWNDYHPLNIVLFGSLAASYGFFAFFQKSAFDRNASPKA